MTNTTPPVKTKGIAGLKNKRVFFRGNPLLPEDLLMLTRPINTPDEILNKHGKLTETTTVNLMNGTVEVSGYFIVSHQMSFYNGRGGRLKWYASSGAALELFQRLGRLVPFDNSYVYGLHVGRNDIKPKRTNIDEHFTRAERETAYWLEDNYPTLLLPFNDETCKFVKHPTGSDELDGIDERLLPLNVKIDKIEDATSVPYSLTMENYLLNRKRLFVDENAFNEHFVAGWLAYSFRENDAFLHLQNRTTYNALRRIPYLRVKRNKVLYSAEGLDANSVTQAHPDLDYPDGLQVVIPDPQTPFYTLGYREFFPFIGRSGTTNVSSDAAMRKEGYIPLNINYNDGLWHLGFTGTDSVTPYRLVPTVGFMNVFLEGNMLNESDGILNLASRFRLKPYDKEGKDFEDRSRGNPHGGPVTKAGEDNQNATYYGHFLGLNHEAYWASIEGGGVYATRLLNPTPDYIGGVRIVPYRYTLYADDLTSLIGFANRLHAGLIWRDTEAGEVLNQYEQTGNQELAGRKDINERSVISLLNLDKNSPVTELINYMAIIPPIVCHRGGEGLLSSIERHLSDKRLYNGIFFREDGALIVNGITSPDNFVSPFGGEFAFNDLTDEKNRLERYNGTNHFTTGDFCPIGVRVKEVLLNGKVLTLGELERLTKVSGKQVSDTAITKNLFVRLDDDTLVNFYEYLLSKHRTEIERYHVNFGNEIPLNSIGFGIVPTNKEYNEAIGQPNSTDRISFEKYLMEGKRPQFASGILLAEVDAYRKYGAGDNYDFWFENDNWNVAPSVNKRDPQIKVTIDVKRNEANNEAFAFNVVSLDGVHGVSIMENDTNEPFLWSMDEVWNGQEFIKYSHLSDHIGYAENSYWRSLWEGGEGKKVFEFEKDLNSYNNLNPSVPKKFSKTARRHWSKDYDYSSVGAVSFESTPPTGYLVFKVEIYGNKTPSTRVFNETTNEWEAGEFQNTDHYVIIKRDQLTLGLNQLETFTEVDSRILNIQTSTRFEYKPLVSIKMSRERNPRQRTPYFSTNMVNGQYNVYNLKSRFAYNIISEKRRFNQEDAQRFIDFWNRKERNVPGTPSHDYSTLRTQYGLPDLGEDVIVHRFNVMAMSRIDEHGTKTRYLYDQYKNSYTEAKLTHGLIDGIGRVDVSYKDVAHGEESRPLSEGGGKSGNTLAYIYDSKYIYIYRWRDRELYNIHMSDSDKITQLTVGCSTLPNVLPKQFDIIQSYRFIGDDLDFSSSNCFFEYEQLDSSYQRMIYFNDGERDYYISTAKRVNG